MRSTSSARELELGGGSTCPRRENDESSPLMFDQLPHDYLSVVWKRSTKVKETEMNSSVEDVGKTVRRWWCWWRQRTRKVKSEMKRPPTGGNKKASGKT